MRQKETFITHVTRRSMYMTVDAALFRRSIPLKYSKLIWASEPIHECYNHNLELHSVQ